jgi:hypothetical protein
MQNWLQLGNWNAICDSCGRKFKASSLHKRWDGMMVCEEDWEQRHPQDLLRVQREQIAVPWSRPQAPDTFINSCDIWSSSGFVGLGSAGCMKAGNSSPSYEYLLGLLGQTPNPDLLFDKVYLLLHMDGVNNTPVFPDSSMLASTVVVGNNTKISSAQGTFNNASALFDGTGDYLTVGGSNNWWFLNRCILSYTVEMWIRPTGSFSSGMTLASNNTISANNFAYYLLQINTAGKLSLNIGHNINTYNIAVTGSNTLLLDTWQHVAHTYDITNRQHYLFVDGNLVGTVGANPLFPTTEGGDRPLTIGSRADASKTIGFNGNMTEFRVTIAPRYTASFPTPTAPPQNAPPTPQVKDPFFANVTSLIHADLLDETTGFTEVTGKVWTSISASTISMISQAKYGVSSLYGIGTGSVVNRFTTPYTTAFDFGSGDFTIEGYIKPKTIIDNAYNFRTIFGCTDTQLRPINVALHTTLNTVKMSCGNSINVDYNVVGPTNSITTTKFSHFACVRYGNTIQVFVDGIGGTPVIMAGSLKITGALPTIFQDNYANIVTLFDGFLDEFRITKGVARYTSNFTPPTTTFPNSA